MRSVGGRIWGSTFG